LVSPFGATETNTQGGKGVGRHSVNVDPSKNLGVGLRGELALEPVHPGPIRPAAGKNRGWKKEKRGDVLAMRARSIERGRQIQKSETTEP